MMMDKNENNVRFRRSSEWLGGFGVSGWVVGLLRWRGCFEVSGENLLVIKMEQRG